MLSPFEQNTTIGERMLRRSIIVPSEHLIMPAASLLPMNSSSTMDWISSAFRLTCPPHHCSKPDIARALGVDLSVEIVLLGPQRVGGILVFEILHQPSAVELAVAEVAGERGQPAAAQQTAASSASGSCRARRAQ